MGRSAEFEMGKVSAKEIIPGDYLDPNVKVRVHAARMIGDNIVVAHKLRGSKAPGVTSYHPDQEVRVWRKK